MTDLSHLDALRARLAHENEYLAGERTENGRKLRRVWIAQVEKEIAFEYKHLGIEPVADVDMNDDDLLAELLA